MPAVRGPGPHIHIHTYKEEEGHPIERDGMGSDGMGSDQSVRGG